jgi:hypothetical protein
MSAHASASIASAALAFVLLSAPFEEHLRKKNAGMAWIKNQDCATWNCL